MMHQLSVVFTLGLLACGAMATGTWKVMQDDKACLLADLDLTFKVSYTGNKNASSKQATFTLPENATVDPAGSSCGDKESKITLAFNDVYRLLFNFKVMGKSYILNSVEFNYTEDAARFPDAAEPGKVMKKGGDTSLFETPNGHSYRCNSMNSDTSISGLELIFTNVKLQPFGVNTNGSFSEEFVCTSDLAKTTTVLPTTAKPTTAKPTTAKPTTAKPTTTPMANMTTIILTTIIDNTTTALETTTPQIVTTVTPKPPTEGNWTVKDGNVTCMNMAFKANFSFFYTDKANKSVSKNVMLPFDADASMSSCSKNSSTFILQFDQYNETWMMTMVFELLDSKNFTQKKGEFNAFKMTELNVTFWDPLHEEDEAYASGNFFETKLNKTYKCDAGEVIQAHNMNVTFADVKFQPFANGDKYPGELQDCKMDDKSSNIVPIAVGCALAGLVVIVLIAYLIGRKRTKNVGYQTV